MQLVENIGLRDAFEITSTKVVQFEKYTRDEKDKKIRKNKEIDNHEYPRSEKNANDGGNR